MPNYLRRNAMFSMAPQVVAFHPVTEEQHRFDAWSELIFLAANGERTSEELIAQLSKQLDDPDLPRVVLKLAARMVEQRWLTVSETPSPLTPELALPLPTL